MVVLISGLIGVIVGAVVTTIIFRMRRGSGTLRIDHSNPEKDVYRFDIDDFDSLSTRTSVLLKVDHNASLSQK